MQMCKKGRYGDLRPYFQSNQLKWYAGALSGFDKGCVTEGLGEDRVMRARLDLFHDSPVGSQQRIQLRDC
jgi:hypothetical protein